MESESPKLKTFGLDCWGWYLTVEAIDVEDARARAIAEASSELEREMAEMANIKELAPETAPALEL